MSTDTQKAKKTRKVDPNKPRKPRAKVDMSVAATVDFSQALANIGGTPTWISSAGSMEDASTWRPESVGQELIGVHAGVDNRGVNQKYYKVAVPDNDPNNAQGYRFEYIKAGMGNKRMDNITPGKGVRLVYKGHAETKAREGEKPRQYRDFDVFQTSR